MNAPNFLESHVSQIPAIQFLQQLGFAYVNPEEVAVERRAAAELRLLRQQRAALDHQKHGLMQQLLTGPKLIRVYSHFYGITSIHT